MSQLTHFCRMLAERAAQQNIRYLVVAKGCKAWSEKVVESFSLHYAEKLFCGEPLFDGCESIPFKKAKLWLGRECQMLTINGHHGIDAQALGALSGTVVGGGVLLLLLPDEWFEQTDSHFCHRLKHLLQHNSVVWLEAEQPLPSLPDVDCVPAAIGNESKSMASEVVTLPFGALTACQVGAVEAIRKVVTGHRKRPLVLTADRGRGKSAALGLAAASLLAERDINIVVTAPSYLASQTVFQHVAEQFGLAFADQKRLEVGKGCIEFVAPDVLLTGLPSADVVFVDEAAAIPSPVLQSLLAAFNRLVFSSTVHGYEGTGRGFAVKFRQQLDSVMPQWRSFEMKQAIRWADNDPLEKWIFNTLLLDAEIATTGLDPATASYEYLDKAQLLSSPILLSSLFGLLVNAHYQTSPADLVNLLDDDALHIWLCRNGDNVLGCCLIVDEGGFGKELAEQVLLGKRRPRGHLLAQSLAAHLGIVEGAVQRSGRILRIAVHPDFQQQGIGQQLLASVRGWASSRYDFLGTSFGYAPELLSFWQRAGYQPVRLGLQKDAASGYPSLLCVQPISDRGQLWFPKARVLFAAGLMANASEAFKGMPTDELLPLLIEATSLHPIPTSLPSEWIEQQLHLFGVGGLGYELVLPALQQYVWQRLVSSTDLSQLSSLDLVVAKVIQRKPWGDIVTQFKLTGRKQAEQVLRDIVSADLQNNSLARSE
ncbi:tRNA(Met) cytidine acetyltransferase TmcA [Photobacterium rosenbergii]|uniref:tRNA(Met) cytidine acetyltransferase TmcA n=1 Tax=Photobacterium rosenbergii TaxID=294936 RepID=UPI001C99C204|nr:GNAT family N-acetyltransferase [Photobacterium rosenbergii]MBY5946726.1 GNAT family N-acetyltransferase [Photobacterium rosenbergii]